MNARENFVAQLLRVENVEAQIERMRRDFTPAFDATVYECPACGKGFRMPQCGHCGHVVSHNELGEWPGSTEIEE